MLAPSIVLASGEKKRCSDAAKRAGQQCKQAAEGAEKAGQAHNQAGTAQDAAHGGNSDRGSGNLCPRIQDQQKNLNTAQGQCQAAKAKCMQECQDAVTQDQQHSSQQPPQHPPENPDPSECGQQVDPKMADLAKAAAPLAGQAAEACKSGDESKAGGPPQIPPIQPPQKNDDKKEAEKREALKCESSEGTRYSDCNNYYLGKCSKDITSASCSEFSDRYCGAATPGKQADVTINNPGAAYKAQSTGFKTASVVVDKGGEGLGSGFCKMVQAYKFCQASNRAVCPSCQGSYGWDTPACQNDPAKCIPSLTGTQLLNAKENCPTDPIFLDPNVQKQVAEAEAKKNNPEATAGKTPPNQPNGGGTAGGSPGGGGGVPGGGGGGGAGGAEYGATYPESIPAGTAVGVGTGNGGGGGGGYNPASASEEEDADGDRQPSGLSDDSIMPAAAPEGMAADVSNQFGPNVFSISTGVYRTLCTQGRLTHCGPRRR